MKTTFYVGATESGHAGGNMRTLIIDRNHDVRWLSVLSKTADRFFIDRTVPRRIRNNGKWLDPAEPLIRHEMAEFREMRKEVGAFKAKYGHEPSTKEREAIYHKAHKEHGNIAERDWLTENGFDVSSWNTWCRSQLARLEKKKATRAPPSEDVSIVPHSRGDLQVARADGGRIDDDLPVMVDPLAGKRSIGDRPDVQGALKDYAKAAAEPFGRVGRIITGQSQEPLQDAAMAAMSMVGPPGSPALRPIAGAAGYALSKGIRALARDVERPAVLTVRAAGGRVEPRNINHNPTPAQAEAGNYAKDRLSIRGIPLTIENAKGSIRRGVGKGGPWQCRLPCHYGFTPKAEGADGDKLDVFLGPHRAAPNVWIVNQIDADTKRFDELKALMGFANEKQALKAYEGAFSDGKGRDRIGHVTEMTFDGFKNWLKKDDAARPV